MKLTLTQSHNDVINWKPFPPSWPCARGIRRSTGFPSQRPTTWAWIFCICAWTNGLANNRDPGDLRRHRAHYDVTVMLSRGRHTVSQQLVTIGSINSTSPFLRHLDLQEKVVCKMSAILLSPNWFKKWVRVIQLCAYGLRLTHWGRGTHICVSELTIIGSDNGLSPGRRQAIMWNNAGLL